jgi:hypothetical protein
VVVLQWMMAEIGFLDPNDVGPASAALIEHGFDIEVLTDDDHIDEYSPAVEIVARTITELDGVRLIRWVQNILEPFPTGECRAAGPCDVTATQAAGRA